MSGWRRATAAIARRVRGPYVAIGHLDARLREVGQRVAGAEETLALAREMLDTTRQTRDLAAATYALLSGEMRAALRAVVAEESANRRRLNELRAQPEYSAAWTQERPLVSVTIATRDRPEVLASRSLPSVLAQTYGELEVIVVGDNAAGSTEEAVRSCDDTRVSYRNLANRVHFTDDPRRHWLVASTMARNEAMRLARGRWVMSFDDDDALRPNCIERLLVRAREDQLEAVYGRVVARREEQPPFEIGVFPPELGRFSWAGGMYHAGLRFFQRELFAADLGLPGDWFLAERMLRAGVRFGMVEEALCDIYPSAMNEVSPARG